MTSHCYGPVAPGRQAKIQVSLQIVTIRTLDNLSHVPSREIEFEDPAGLVTGVAPRDHDLILAARDSETIDSPESQRASHGAYACRTELYLEQPGPGEQK